MSVTGVATEIMEVWAGGGVPFGLKVAYILGQAALKTSKVALKSPLTPVEVTGTLLKNSGDDNNSNRERFSNKTQTHCRRNKNLNRNIHCPQHEGRRFTCATFREDRTSCTNRKSCMLSN